MKYFIHFLYTFSVWIAFGQIHPFPVHIRHENYPLLGKTPDGMELVLVNYSTTTTILKYKKLELGVKLPHEVLQRINHFLLSEGRDADELNPFVEWDVDVETYFYHPATGILKTIDGYYHREYIENPHTDDWDDIGTGYPFRVRFAPPENGQWMAKTAIKIKGETAYEIPWFVFHVTESGNPGYVSVHPNKKNLVRGGEIIFPVGHNFAGPDEHGLEWGLKTECLGNNLLSPQTTFKATNTKEWDFYLQKVTDYLERGGKYIRTIQSPWATLIEFEKKGNYYDRLHYAWEQDKLLDVCEAHDAFIMFNMLIHTPLCVYDIYRMSLWDWEKWEIWEHDTVYYSETPYPLYCYNDRPKEIGGKQPYETFLEEEDLKYHEQRTRYYISRYGYSTAIYEFELLSEPFNVNTNPLAGLKPYEDNTNPLQEKVFAAIENYQRRISTYIKEKMNHTHHLIGVDYTMYVWRPDKKNVRMDQSLLLENVDLIGINFYSREFNKYVIRKSEENNLFEPGENSRAKSVFDFNDWSGKPVLLSEFGDGDGAHECSQFTGSYTDAMVAGFTGVAGYHLWEGRVVRDSFLWSATINAQQHMNSPEVIRTLENGNGEWIQGRQQARITRSKKGKAALELQYYLSHDRSTSVGYVRNRSYNVYTKRIDDSYGCLLNLNDDPTVSRLTDISWDMPSVKNRLKVEELKKNTNYQIEWYSFKEGKLLLSECVRTTGSSLVLHYPVLVVTDPNREQPVIWFTIKENDCSASR